MAKQLIEAHLSPKQEKFGNPLENTGKKRKRKKEDSANKGPL